MPWCPQCDEIFPSGPSCPRCRTHLVDMADLTGTHEPTVGGTLPQLKVPRRLRRAFDRMNRPPVPPRQLITVVLGLLVFLAGMAVGQVGSRPLPVIEGPPRAEPMDVPEQTTLGFVVEENRGRGLPGLLVMRRSMDSGAMHAAGRLDLRGIQVNASGRLSARFRSLGGSVAVMVESGDRWLASALPDDGAPLGWLPALDVVWENPSSLLLLDEGGDLARWMFGNPSKEAIAGEWIGVYQTATGAAVESWGPDGRMLSLSSPDGPVPGMKIPAEVDLLAVGPSARLALVSTKAGPAVWDGTDLAVAEVKGFEPVAASFSSDGSRVAVTMHQRGSDEADVAVALVVLDDRGRQISFDRITVIRSGRECTPVPVWDPAGSWVFVAPGDRHLYGLQVGGGRRPKARLGNAGCGLAWAA